MGLRAFGVVLFVAAAASCSSSTETTAGPTPLKCQVSLTLQPLAMTSTGGAGVVTVATQPECAWNAASEASWITGITPTSGQGNGEVHFQVSTNPIATARQGDVVLNDVHVHVTQPGAVCQIAISPANLDVPTGGGTGSIAVTSATGCGWAASSGAPWITVMSGANGSGNAAVGFSVAANAGATRSGTIAIGDQVFVVTQPGVGVPPCQFGISPANQNVAATGGSGTIAVTSAAGCGWTASSGASWLTVTSGASGSGNGTVAFSAAANIGVARSATITIGGQAFTVTQSASAPACQYMIQPTSTSSGSAGGTALVTVQTTAACAWTSTSNAAWLTFNGASAGAGNGSVTIVVAQNTGNTRTGTVTVAGQTFTVTQTGSCAVSISPAAQTVPAAGGTAANVAVTAAAGCGWTSVASAGWITITAGASGTGNGTVTFTVGATTGPARTATVTIGGQVHTVNQTSGCTYAINPTSRSIGKGQMTGQSVTVSTTAGCGWTATADVSWLSISAGASGTGNGTVTYNVDQNGTGVARVGTLTIAGLTLTINQGK